MNKLHKKVKKYNKPKIKQILDKLKVFISKTLMIKNIYKTDVYITNDKKDKIIGLLYDKEHFTAPLISEKLTKLPKNTNIKIITNNELANILYDVDLYDEITLEAYKEVSEIYSELWKDKKIFEEYSDYSPILTLNLSKKLYKKLDNDIITIKLDNVKKDILKEYGFIPHIKYIKDTNLKENEYSINIRNTQIAKKELIFSLGDTTTDISKHIYREITNNLEDVITLQNIIEIIQVLKKEFPDIINEAMKKIDYTDIFLISKNLLREKIPITDMLTIIETLIECSEIKMGGTILRETIRARLNKTITKEFEDPKDNKVHLITLVQELESKFMDKIDDRNILQLTTSEIQLFVSKTREILNNHTYKLVLVVAPEIRRQIVEMYKKFDIDLAVLSHSELNPKAEFTVEANIDFDIED